jgi:hypothetical protein
LRLSISQNPTKDIALVHVTTTQTCRVKAVIASTSGSVIAALFDGQMNAGGYDLRWNTSGIANGTYQCIVQSGHSLERIPVVVAH